MSTLRSLAFATSVLALATAPLSAAELGGSPTSMRTQHEVAVESDYSFFRTTAQVEHAVDAGRLTKISATADYTLSDVGFPVARSETALFIERLAAQFHDATGTMLVVTSLTRPSSLQPKNAHALSVHPTGMAVDLRVPSQANDRAWLERTLLDLERAGVLDVTRERNPSHYHVAVYPDAYRAYAASHPMPPRVAFIPRLRRVANAVEAMSVSALNVTAPMSPLFAGALLLPMLTVFALRQVDQAETRRRRVASLTKFT